MKTFPILLLVPVALAALSATTQGNSCCGGAMLGQHEAHHADGPIHAKQSKGKQTATIIVDNGYSPAKIEVKRAKPVELTFRGGKSTGCGGTVVFESLKMIKEVATGKSVVFRFTPKEKGEIPFTCGMGMLKGAIVVK